MRVSRYIAEFLKGKVDHVFGLQGGAVVHLFDACERFGPKPIYCHHEQAAGFAAASYARVHGYGACIVTTGPGGTNAITPLLGAWQNHTPVMFISGQVRVGQIPEQGRLGGLQWGPIVDVVRPITKRAATLKVASAIPKLIQRWYERSLEQPSGPVWIDVPLDLQWAEV